MKLANTHVLVQEDEHGDLYIDLPPDMISELGWDENTNLLWSVTENGTILLREENDSSNEA